MSTKAEKQEAVAYPEGYVVGPCVCGSWPGGECLKCPRVIHPPKREWMELTQEEKIELKNSNMPTMALIDTICSILRMQNT